MPIDNPEGREANIEADQEMERAKLEAGLNDLGQNLDQVETSSPTRFQKIVKYVGKHMPELLIASVPLSAAAREITLGNLDEALLKLGIGAAAVGGYKLIMSRLEGLRQKAQKQEGEK